ncbi:hypothetical protein Tco_0979521 [Tanacetum coccineum]
MFNGGVDMVSLNMRCSTKDLRWYCCTLDAQRGSQYGIDVHEMFNEGVKMVPENSLELLKVMENKFELLKVLENNLKSLKVLENNLESLKLHEY